MESCTSASISNRNMAPKLITNVEEIPLSFLLIFLVLWYNNRLQNWIDSHWINNRINTKSRVIEDPTN